MQENLESDWTLGAIKRREEERLRSEGAGETVATHRAADVSGDNWVAEAFRRRQEEERAKAALHHSSGGDHRDAAGREVPVDNWLIEGFKRHQEEERRLEMIVRSDEAGAAAISDDHASFEAKSSPSRAAVAMDAIVLSAQDGTANRASRASDGVRRPSGVGRMIAIAGVIVVGLVSVIGLKTALWNSVDAPRGFDRGAPGAAPPVHAARPAKKENAHPNQGPSPGEAVGNAPPTHPAAGGVAPTGDAAVRPGDSAPAKPGDAATSPARPAEAPQSSTQNPPPNPQSEPKAPPPAAQQSEKPIQENATAPVPSGPKEAPPPAKADTDSAAKPASVGPEKSREGVGAEQDQNASEPRRHGPNDASDAKAKQQAKEKNSARHSAARTDGFSTFLKRTANSVRRFFGRLGARQ